MNSKERVSMSDFEALYEKYGPMVLRRCRFLLKDEDQALDCAQDTFVRIMERRERLNGLCASLFYTVATSVCLNRMRSNRTRWATRIDAMAEEIADAREPGHERRIVAALLLDSLFDGEKDDTRVMAVLHYVDGLTLEETAQETGMSVSGVRKRLSALREKALSSAGEVYEDA
jgi:RNA polymerase sigma-70 factor (ECF subfamily)